MNTSIQAQEDEYERARKAMKEDLAASSEGAPLRVHTPGPWVCTARLSGSENHRGFLIDAKGFTIANVVPMDEDGIEGSANARLIAAAPDLLAALQLMAGLRGFEESEPYAAVVHAVLAKATGA